MGVGLLEGQGQTGGGVAIGVLGDEDGIIAKAVAPFFLEGDVAGPHAGEQVGLAVGVQIADAADEAGGAIRLVPQAVQYGHAPVVLGGQALISGGIDAGFAVQGRYFQAAVVRQHGAMGDIIDGPGFEQGVFLEGLSGLLHLQVDALFALRKHLIAQGLQDFFIFAHLAGVVGGDDQFHILPP